MTTLLDNHRDNSPIHGIRSNSKEVMTLSTKKWLQQHGRMLINLSMGIPRAELQPLNDGKGEVNAMLATEPTKPKPSLVEITASDQSMLYRALPPSSVTKRHPLTATATETEVRRGGKW